MARRKMKFASSKFPNGTRVTFNGLDMLPDGDIVRLPPRQGTVERQGEEDTTWVLLDGDKSATPCLNANLHFTVRE